jgi:hypothetical protein
VRIPNLTTHEASFGAFLVRRLEHRLAYRLEHCLDHRLEHYLEHCLEHYLDYRIGFRRRDRLFLCERHLLPS